MRTVKFHGLLARTGLLVTYELLRSVQFQEKTCTYVFTNGSDPELTLNSTPELLDRFRKFILVGLEFYEQESKKRPQDHRNKKALEEYKNLLKSFDEQAETQP